MEKKRIIIIDDNKKKLRPILDGIAASWDFTVVETAREALTLLNGAGERFPDVVSVDLGLAGDPDGPTEGLKALAQIRTEYPTANLIVHSVQTVDVPVAREILNNRASFIRTGNDKGIDAFVSQLDAVSEGYLVYSTSMAALIPKILGLRNDLTSEDWKLLKLLASDDPKYSEEDLGQFFRLSSRSISTKISELADKLERLGLIPKDQTIHKTKPHHRDRLVLFHKKHRKDYGIP